MFGNTLAYFAATSGVARPVKVSGDDFLPFLGVQIFEVGPGDFGRPASDRDLVDDGHRWFGQDADGRIDDLELSLTHLVHGELCLVLPVDEHVADSPLREGSECTAGPGIEHRHVLEQFRQVRLGCRRAAAGLLQGPRPRPRGNSSGRLPTSWGSA
jgi:hypothetical protein